MPGDLKRKRLGTRKHHPSKWIHLTIVVTAFQGAHVERGRTRGTAEPVSQEYVESAEGRDDSAVWHLRSRASRTNVYSRSDYSTNNLLNDAVGLRKIGC